MIAQRYRVGRYASSRTFAAPGSLLPTHFEDIGEIGGKTDTERHHVPPHIEIADQQQLIMRRPPNELAAIYINQLALQQAAIGGYRIGIGEIDRQQRVVLGLGGAQQQWTIAIEPQLELRQEARVLVIQPVGTARVADHVAKPAQHGKGVAMLQDAGSRLVILARRRDAELRSAFTAPASRDRHAIPQSRNR